MQWRIEPVPEGVASLLAHSLQRWPCERSGGISSNDRAIWDILRNDRSHADDGSSTDCEPLPDHRSATDVCPVADSHVPVQACARPDRHMVSDHVFMPDVGVHMAQQLPSKLGRNCGMGMVSKERPRSNLHARRYDRAGRNDRSEASAYEARLDTASAVRVGGRDENLVIVSNVRRTDYWSPQKRLGAGVIAEGDISRAGCDGPYFTAEPACTVDHQPSHPRILRLSYRASKQNPFILTINKGRGA